MRDSSLPDLGDLTDAQRRAVTAGVGPLCVVAAAGSGKTRVLTRRIAYRVSTGTADPRHVLALTFTRKAAGELGGRLTALGLRERIVAGTFHAVAAAQLRQWWADRGQCPPVLIERTSRVLGPLAAARPGTAGVRAPELAGHLEWARARMIAPGQFAAAALAAGRRLPVPAGEIAALYERYEHEKRRRGLIDFDDLLGRCADALESDPTFAAAQRWRWRHIHVDEFQDVNPLQHRLLSAWVGDRLDLCVVGDPNQSIYGWNGADPGLLDAMADRWPGTTVVHLDDNHRSSPQIVAAAAAVLGGAGRHLVSTRPDGSAPTVRAYADDRAEAAGVASDVVAAAGRGLRWSSMAVLVRTNAQAVALRSAFETAGVPCRALGAGSLLDDPTARVALTDLRTCAGQPLAGAATDLEEASAGVSTWGPAGEVGDPLVLAALGRLARDLCAMDPRATIGQWLAWLPTALGRDTPSTGDDTVTISSFHRAKGLEWPAVWICGVEQGLVPIGQATTPDELAEERRLLYVALTRARTEVHLSWCGGRSFGGRPAPRQPSPWLALIDDGSAGTRPAEVTVDAATWRSRLDEQRRWLADGRPGGTRRPGRRGGPREQLSRPEPELVAALERWRSSAARASGVPGHVLLHDRTLQALASLRPGTEEELLTVPGLGPVKAARHGAVLLALVRAAPPSTPASPSTPAMAVANPAGRRTG